MRILKTLVQSNLFISVSLPTKLLVGIKRRRYKVHIRALMVDLLLLIKTSGNFSDPVTFVARITVILSFDNFSH